MAKHAFTGDNAAIDVATRAVQRQGSDKERDEKLYIRRFLFSVSFAGRPIAGSGFFGRTRRSNFIV